MSSKGSFFCMFCCKNVVTVCVSRSGESLLGVSGLSQSTRSECQCIPVGPREPVGVMPFMLIWVSNPTKMLVNILKEIP